MELESVCVWTAMAMKSEVCLLETRLLVVLIQKLYVLTVKTEIKTEIKLEPKLEPMEVDLTPESFHIYPTCGICLEPFQITHSPLVASQSANSSNRLPFGLRLPCPHSHAYCISCLSSYIKSKLDPDGDGQGRPAASVVFPIRCPECPLADWIEGITDDVAEKIMDEKFMVLWVSSYSHYILFLAD